MCALCFAHECGWRETDHPCGYDIKEVDEWCEALRKELTSIVEKHKGEPLAEPAIILLEKLLDEWLK